MIRKASTGDSSELAWLRSSYSSNSSDPNCVEVAHTPEMVHVRDSKATQGPRLAVGGPAWADFLAYAARS